MIIQKLAIAEIPAIIWGENSPWRFIAVHGNMSNKADQVIVIVAEKMTQLGYHVSGMLPFLTFKTDKSNLLEAKV